MYKLMMFGPQNPTQCFCSAVKLQQFNQTRQSRTLLLSPCTRIFLEYAPGNCATADEYLSIHRHPLSASSYKLIAELKLCGFTKEVTWSSALFFLSCFKKWEWFKTLLSRGMIGALSPNQLPAAMSTILPRQACAWDGATWSFLCFLPQQDDWAATSDGGV